MGRRSIYGEPMFKVTMAIPKDLLEKIEKEADRRGITKNELLREVLQAIFGRIE